jgi:hypothetical protein
MAQVNFLFEFADDQHLDESAQTIEQQLDKVESVQEVSAIPEKPRITGLEIAAAIAVTALIVHNSGDLVKAVRELVTEVKKLMVEIHDLKQVYISIAGRRVDVTEITDKQIQELATEQ